MQKEPPHFQPMAYLLAVAHTLTCLAYAWRINRFSCKTFSFLWSDNGFTEVFAGRVESIMIFLLIAGAIFIWIPKVRGLALLGIIPMIFEFCSETFATSAKYPLIYWGEWALRYSTPIAALILFQSLETSKNRCITILRIATSAVFIAHGIKALLGDPKFIDFILVSLRRMGLDGNHEGFALTAVHAIGTIDILLGLHLLFFKIKRNRMVLIWMAAWGLLTAFARIMYGGSANWHEVLIRTTHFITPAVLMLLIFSRRWNKETENIEA